MRWSDRALRQLQQIHGAQVPGDTHPQLVRRLIQLENDASTFEAIYNPVVLESNAVPGAGPLRLHVMEAGAGMVFVISYRLADDAADVWVNAIDSDR